MAQRTGHTILERYGMSETVMLTSNPYHAEGRRPARRHRRLPAAGVNCGCRTTKVFRCPLPPARSAASRCKGPNVFKGYWRMPEKTARSSPPTAGSRPATSARSMQRLCHHRRPQQGPDHHRRLQRLPGRDRGLPERHARRGRERGDRRAAPGFRRGRGGGGHVPKPGATDGRCR
jgi:acyl-CoA synthetase (AMP-forming)/AMP-acid ligase II